MLQVLWMLLRIHLELLFYFEQSSNIQVVKSQNAETLHQTANRHS